MLRLLNLNHTFSKFMDLAIVAKGLKNGSQPVICQMPAVKTHGQIQINHPLQAMLGALVTCETHTAFHIAKKDGVDLKQLDWNNVNSKIDVQGWIKGVQSPKTYEDINIQVDVTTSVSQNDIEKFFRKVQRVCPVYRTLEAAGIKINTKINIRNN